jgi:serine/threonine protein kinase
MTSSQTLFVVQRSQSSRSGPLPERPTDIGRYLAPEVLLDEKGYGKHVDFWSLGVLLFEMCCGWSPFYAEQTQEMYRLICERLYQVHFGRC